MKKQWLGALLVLGCALAHAEESHWRFVGRLGSGFGGDKMEQGNYVGGAPWELSAGSGWKFAVGTDYRISEKVTLQGTVGRDVSTVPAQQGDQYFERIPVELLGFYDLSKQVRLGGGLRYSANSKMSANGAYVNDPLNGNFGVTPGFVIEGQYLTERAGGNAQFGVSLRYVNESFSKNGLNFSGNHGEIALVLYY